MKTVTISPRIQAVKKAGSLMDQSEAIFCFPRSAEGGDPSDGEISGEQIYRYFLSALLKYGRYRVNSRTRAKLRLLTEIYQLSRDDILQEMITAFYSNGFPERHDSNRSSMPTFIVGFADRCLNNMVAKAIARSKRTGITINFDGLSDTFLHQYGQWDGIDWVTPEDHLLGRELLEIMVEHYGKIDTAVLLGIFDRHEAAIEMGLTYQAYCKRLERKTLNFINSIFEAESD